MVKAVKKEIDLTDFLHLYPFNKKNFNVNGFKYHFVDEGCGEPVVMVHGNPTWSFYFRSLIKEFSANYRTIAVDHIGCGLSEKPNARQYGFKLQNRVDDFEAFMEKLQLKEKITLIVHDWGGAIGLIYALRNLNKIGRIVVTNTSCFFPPEGKTIPKRLKIVRNMTSFATPAVLGFNLFSVSALYMAAATKLSKPVKKGLTAPYNSWNNRLATLKFVQDIPINKTDESYDLIKFLDENSFKLSDIPMLICWGGKDFVFDSSYYNEWVNRFPHAKSFFINDAGHYLLEDAPDEVVTIIKDFLSNNPV